MYKPNELRENTTGIYKRFPKLSTYEKSLKNWGVDYSKSILCLEAYSGGNVFEFSHMDEYQCKKSGIPYKPKIYKYTDMMHDLEQYSTRRFIDSYLLCFEGNDSWKEVFKEAVACRYWSNKICLDFHEMAYQQYMSGKRVQKLRMLSLRYVGVEIGFCMSLGWLDYARDLRDKVNSALEKGLLYDGYDSSCRRRTQHFVIRLLNSYDGKEDIQRKLNIECAYDLTLFNDLIDKWKTDDVNELRAILVNACDRHTHQCRQDSWNNNRFYDFENIPLEYYIPFEILSIFRLREYLNLDNPSVNHQLMNSPLASLHSVSNPFRNTFLDSLVTRAKAEMVETQGTPILNNE